MSQSINTFEIVNVITKQRMVINQVDYVGSMSFSCGGEWQIVSSNNAGGEEGDKEAQMGRNIVNNLHLKRKSDAIRI